MRLDTPFVRLPIAVDAAALAAEVAAAPADAWRADPRGVPGISELPLVSVDGDPTSDATEGPMRPTPTLPDLPTVANVLATLTALECPVGRTRLVRIEAGDEGTDHVDLDRYSWDHLRIHVPVVTDPAVRFVAGNEQVHMAAGEYWVFDTWSRHRVENPADAPRIHLVIDTVGGAGLWSLIDRQTGVDDPDSPLPTLAPVKTIAYEDVLVAPVMASSEIDTTLQTLLAEFGSVDPAAANALERALVPFRRSWRAVWARFGTDPTGLPTYRALIAETDAIVGSVHGLLPNGIAIAHAIRSLVLQSALPRSEVGSDTTQRGAGAASARTGAPDGNAPPEFRSEASTNFPEILHHADLSLALTTNRSDRLVLLRSEGDRINTHMRSFDQPKAIAAQSPNLALGTRTAVWGFRNHPAAASVIDPGGRTDACFVPQEAHVTGDIDVQELAYDGEGVLWAVATRFSCLVNFEKGTSFAPRWRPPFVTALAGEDRCHLNGLAMVDGRPKYVTVLATTDTADGWRDHKANGGAILDVDTGEAIATGLSMPHSPRWHDGRLWVLESGRGAVCTVDVATGDVTTVATLPGFTRGLSFAGGLAFVGVSRVHETLFDDLPITRSDQPQECGVWVVDTVTGVPLGHLRFTGAVNEIYEVTVLPGLGFPDLVEPGAEEVGNLIVVDERFLTDDAAWQELAPGAR